MDPRELTTLLAIMARLRDPEHGCPWDRAQDFASIVPYTLEEAYEVAETIEQEEWPALKGELGDLLFQVVFYSQIARERELFEFADVVQAISEKMLRRHPHVFGDEDVSSAEHQTQRWEELKAAEQPARQSQMDDVSTAIPALVRAKKLQSRAAQVGFDWPGIDSVLDKLNEELDEVREAMASESEDAVFEEVGDLFLVCVNLARHLKIDAEAALRAANRKFEQRFRQMEEFAAADGQQLRELSLDEQEALWLRAKAAKER